MNVVSQDMMWLSVQHRHFACTCQQIFTIHPVFNHCIEGGLPCLYLYLEDVLQRYSVEEYLPWLFSFDKVRVQSIIAYYFLLIQMELLSTISLTIILYFLCCTLSPWPIIRQNAVKGNDCSIRLLPSLACHQFDSYKGNQCSFLIGFCPCFRP